MNECTGSGVFGVYLSSTAENASPPKTPDPFRHAGAELLAGPAFASRVRAIARRRRFAGWRLHIQVLGDEVRLEARGQSGGPLQNIAAAAIATSLRANAEMHIRAKNLAAPAALRRGVAVFVP